MKLSKSKKLKTSSKNNAVVAKKNSANKQKSLPVKKPANNLSEKLQKTSELNLSKTNIKLEPKDNLKIKKVSEPDRLGETKKISLEKIGSDLPFNALIKKPIYDICNLSISINKNDVLHNITVKIADRKITALVGPSGAGKTTFLNTLNRLIEYRHRVKITGEILFHNTNIFDRSVNVYRLRQKVGMVFQKPTAFAMSIFDNIAYGPRLHGIKNKTKLTEIVKHSLNNASLYDEVADKLKDSALDLSGGQQQRLCIARVLAVNPQVLLLDEPTSALDPIATVKIEELILRLAKKYSIILITHSIQQTLRCSDNTMFFYKGRVIDYNNTKEMFTNPKNKITKDFITHSTA